MSPGAQNMKTGLDTLRTAENVSGSDNMKVGPDAVGIAENMKTGADTHGTAENKYGSRPPRYR
jgi:hypothetical protein